VPLVLRRPMSGTNRRDASLIYTKLLGYNQQRSNTTIHKIRNLERMKCKSTLMVFKGGAEDRTTWDSDGSRVTLHNKE
jgi:hypothetical protein